MKLNENIANFKNEGYATLHNIYSNKEILVLSQWLDLYKNNNTSEVNKDLYAIRQVLKEIPELKNHLFNKKLISVLNTVFKSNYFLNKAIYFDKPKTSNWFVAYHQDLSISVAHKADVVGYTNWTYKKKQFGVQPPINILERTITVRIHLDHTTKDNGALRVIPKSHAKGIIRPNSKHWDLSKEIICNVNKGSIMLMKPLLLHASNKTINNERRRVIHLEFNDTPLHKPLKWQELEVF